MYTIAGDTRMPTPPTTSHMATPRPLTTVGISSLAYCSDTKYAAAMVILPIRADTSLTCVWSGHVTQYPTLNTVDNIRNSIREYFLPNLLIMKGALQLGI